MRHSSGAFGAISFGAIVVILALAWVSYGVLVSDASGQATQGSPAFVEEQRQTAALERQALALERIYTVLQRMDRRCR